MNIDSGYTAVHVLSISFRMPNKGKCPMGTMSFETTLFRGTPLDEAIFGRTQEVIFVISSVISSEHQIEASQQSADRCATNMPTNIHQQSLIHKWS